MNRLRLVKVFVQPQFVVDDGENITEIEHPVMCIPASEWETYSSGRFQNEMREFQAKLNNDKPEKARSAQRPKASKRGS